MVELFKHPEHVQVWEQALDGHTPDWDTLFAGYRATGDWTAAAFFAELADAYPDAIVLLSVRDADDWWRSFRNTMVETLQSEVDPADPWERVMAPARQLTIRLLGRPVHTRLGRRGRSQGGVRTPQRRRPGRDPAWPAGRVAARRRLGPICAALGLPVPADPFRMSTRPPTSAPAGSRSKETERVPNAVNRFGTRAAGLVAAITVVGAAVRLVILHDSLFADELSTYWIISGRGLGGVISTVHTDAEITPPLYFVLAWLTTRLDLTAEMLRAPSFLAGVAAIPLIYLLGLRTVGRAAALVASADHGARPVHDLSTQRRRGDTR